MQHLHRAVTLFLALLGLTRTLAYAASESKGASIVLKAKWQGTPLLLEAAEFLADEQPQLLWDFLEAWPERNTSRAADCWEQLTEQASQLLSPTMTKVMQVALGVRQYSAHVEMLRTLADQGQQAQQPASCCRAELAGHTATSAAQLASLLEQQLQVPPDSDTSRAGGGSSLQLYAFDHIYPAGSGGAAKEVDVVVVLYGAIGTKCLHEMHAVLKAAAREHDGSSGGRRLVYAYRPVRLHGCTAADELGPGQCSALGTEDQLQLPGFGVEMAIKNIEYSALDDSKAKAAQAAAASAGDEELTEVAGFDFQRLVERKPALRQELITFRDHLVAASAQEDTLKVWDLKDLGLQATQRIAQAADPLRLLTEISQNFPSMASSLSHLRVDPALRGEVVKQQQMVPGGTNLLLINGLLVDIDEVDLFSLLDHIRQEVRLLDALGMTGLASDDLASLVRLRPKSATSASDQGRVDITSPDHLHWLNDLETDPAYRKWRSRITDLLQPAFPGRLQAIRRNLYNAVFLVDPGTAAGLRMLKTTLDTLNQQWPVRLGIMLIPKDAVSRAAATASASADEAAPPSWDDLPVPERISHAFLTIQRTLGTLPAVTFLNNILPPPPGWELDGDDDESDASSADVDADISWEAAERTFGKLWTLQATGIGMPSALEALEQLKSGSGVAEGVREQLRQAAAFAVSRGVAAQGNALWFNGILHPGDSGWRDLLVYHIQQEMQRLQEAVYYQKLHDSESDLLAAILADAKAAPRYNPRVLAPLAAKGMASADAGSAVPGVRQLALTGEHLRLGVAPFMDLGYLHYHETEDNIKAVTHWVVADVDTEEGRELVLQALRHLESEASEQSRMAILQNPRNPDRPPSPLARIVLAATQLPSRRHKIAHFLQQLLSSEKQTRGDELDAAIALAETAGLNSKALARQIQQTAAADSQIAAESQAPRLALGLHPGDAAVVTNGRMVVAHSTSLGISEGLVAEDLALMEVYAAGNQLAEHIAAVVVDALEHGRGMHGTGEDGAGDEDSDELPIRQLSDAAMLASSVLAAHAATGSSQASAQSEQVAKAVAAMPGAHTSLTSPGHLPGLELWAVLNPLSKTAQAVAPILEFLRATLQPRIKVVLNPQRDLSDMPLKSFYRFALPHFQATGDGTLGMPAPPSAHFASLPPRKTLTLGMDVPEPWLVEPVTAHHDLDNLRLEDLVEDRVLSAEFELEALVLSGQCIDVSATRRDQVQPRGVQLQLHTGTNAASPLTDTLVMSNLGYFQLKAAPGAWMLSLAPGRSQELYAIQSSTGVTGGAADSVAAQAGAGATDLQVPVVLSSFAGKHMFLRLRKRPGHEADDVLGGAGDDDGDGSAGGAGLWGRVSNLLGTKDRQKAQTLPQPYEPGQAVAPRNAPLSAEEDPDTIHIFTVASGHMYERLQKIMVLSVIRNTKHRVKVWFIKNYMSPQMKRFLPRMAAHYGFEYEFVTYKWPSWLHKQTEKQRIIWAYKILFLDVLFPLALRKVIFVDADQIIRADMAELWHRDLEGAPYAYVPFCDNNQEMEGFRFWKQGFWKNHLRGKPYHISALYVVDLQRFRRTAAGDTLRVLYDQLSRDPGSLANLDQDLPNYAQHQVAIHSLPQEWLWCESWCGAGTKPAAKTIDLCNNPLTKEPKLTAARRIVPEWPGLDEEVRAFTVQVEAEWDGEAGPGALSAGDTADQQQNSDSNLESEDSISEQTDLGQHQRGVEDEYQEDSGQPSQADHTEL